MNAELSRRAALHKALGDPHRLAVVDALRLSDRTPGELVGLTGLPWNLLAFHLGVLTEAGVVERRRSAGDGRRRYVRLLPGVLDGLHPAAPVRAERVLFVCTANSARSQFAAALWQRATGRPGASAGSDPAAEVHLLAVVVAAAHGLDLAGARPRGYEAVGEPPDLLVSVCDRALEGGVPFEAPRLHWSVADPAGGDRDAFEAAFADVAARVDLLVAAAA